MSHFQGESLPIWTAVTEESSGKQWENFLPAFVFAFHVKVGLNLLNSTSPWHWQKFIGWYWLGATETY